MSEVACSEERKSRRFQVAAEQQGAVLRWQEIDRRAFVTDQSSAGLAVHVARGCDIQPGDVATLSWPPGYCRVRVAHRVESEDGVRLGLVRLEDLYTAAECAMPSSIWSDSPGTRPHFRSNLGYYAVVLLTIVGMVVGLAWQIVPRSGDWNLRTSETSVSKRKQAESSGFVTAPRGVAASTSSTCRDNGRWIATSCPSVDQRHRRCGRESYERDPPFAQEVATGRALYRHRCSQRRGSCRVARPCLASSQGRVAPFTLSATSDRCHSSASARRGERDARPRRGAGNAEDDERSCLNPAPGQRASPGHALTRAGRDATNDRIRQESPTGRAEIEFAPTDFGLLRLVGWQPAFCIAAGARHQFERAGSYSSGKNRPPIGWPVGIGGTPANNGSSEPERTPSRKAFTTTARRGRSVRFSYEP